MVESERKVTKNGVNYMLVPPEGGWGYMVCLSIAIQFTVIFSHVSSFGMIYNDFLVELGEGTSGVTLIFGLYSINLSIASFVSNMLLKRFSIRQVAILGSAIVCVGNFTGIFVTSVSHLVVTYGLILGFGSGLVFPVSYVSFNTYFTQHKLAYFSAVKCIVGMASAGVPLLIKQWMDWFGFRGTLAMLFAVQLNSFLGSVMLQPVDWHLKLVEIHEEREIYEDTPLNSNDETIVIAEKLLTDGDTTENLKSEFTEKSTANAKENRKFSYDSQAQEEVSAMAKKRLSVSYIVETEGRQANIYRATAIESHSDKQHDKTNATVKTEHGLSFEGINSQDEMFMAKMARAGSIISLGNAVIMEPVSPIVDKQGRLNFIVDYLDLSLFKDKVYTNIVIGISTTAFADCTFFMLLPLSLYKMGWDSDLVSRSLALAAAGDMVGKLLLVVVSKTAHVSSRYVFLVGMLACVVLRCVYDLLSGTVARIVLITAMGGVRALLYGTSPLVCAEYVPVQRYPAAFGLQMLLYGVFNILGGPAIGIIRDVTGSYPLVFRILTSVIVISALPWLVELYFSRKPAHVAIKEALKVDQRAS